MCHNHDKPETGHPTILWRPRFFSLFLMSKVPAFRRVYRGLITLKQSIR